MTMIWRSTAILSVGLLTLSACQPPADQTTDDPGQEDLDPSGAQDQGNRPGEIAGEDSEDQEGAQPDGSASDVPDFAEIEEEIWEESASQDSVHITGEVSPALLGWADAELDGPLEDEAGAGDPEDQETQEETDDPGDQAAEPVQLTISGNSEGEGSVYRVGEVLDFLIFGDDVYQSVDSVVAEYEHRAPEEVEAPSAAEIREAFEAEGSWADFGPTGREHVETPAEFMQNLRSGFLQSAELDALAEADLQGSVDTREGENVWVYTAEEQDAAVEIAVAAEEGEPLLQQLVLQVDGERFEVTFTDWNEASEPEEPAEEEVIAPEEVEALLQSLM